MTRPVITADWACASTGATKSSAQKAPTKNFVERNSFVMRTSEGFAGTTELFTTPNAPLTVGRAGSSFFLKGFFAVGNRYESRGYQPNSKKEKACQDGRVSELAISF